MWDLPDTNEFHGVEARNDHDEESESAANPVGPRGCKEGIQCHAAQLEGLSDGQEYPHKRRWKTEAAFMGHAPRKHRDESYWGEEKEFTT